MTKQSARIAFLLLTASWFGCRAPLEAPRQNAPTVARPPAVMPVSYVPRELSKTFLPTYVIEPPDVLLISALHAVPKAPYRLNPFDTLLIQVENTLPDAPLTGPYTIEPGGYVNLGVDYGRIKVSKLTTDEAGTVVQDHLRKFLRDPLVSVTLVEVASKQQIAGEHLVGPDGNITLGTYGSVRIGGLTIQEAKMQIEAHLETYLEDPEVAVDVYAYNSKSYYVITQGAGLGDGVSRFPVTGNETVLDAISQIQGLDAVSSKIIWVARPAPSIEQCDQILPVDWQAITQRGITDTNYQLLPGDRVFIAEDKMVAFDTWVGKMISPFERIFGFVSLGTQTVSGIRFFQERGTRGFGF